MNSDKLRQKLAKKLISIEKHGTNRYFFRPVVFFCYLNDEIEVPYEKRYSRKEIYDYIFMLLPLIPDDYKILSRHRRAFFRINRGQNS